jgi:hypothetical protein
MLAVAYATGRASHARQVNGDDPDKKGYPGSPDCGLGVRLTNPPSKKNTVTKPIKKNSGGQGPYRAVQPMMMMIHALNILSFLTGSL